MKHRFSKSELIAMTDNEVVVVLINERLYDLTNKQGPFAERLNDIKRKLSDKIRKEKLNVEV